jgi:hypothetical protein
MRFFFIVQLLHNCIWACIQFWKHFYIRRHSKVIFRINHLSSILPKSLIMTWRSSWKLSKHSFARLCKMSAKNSIFKMFAPDQHKNASRDNIKPWLDLCSLRALPKPSLHLSSSVYADGCKPIHKSFEKNVWSTNPWSTLQLYACPCCNSSWHLSFINRTHQ